MKISSQLANNFGYCSAEKDQAKALGEMSLNSEWFESLLPRFFLCAHRVSAVPWCAPPLNRRGQEKQA